MKEFFIADASRFENQVVTSYFALASVSVRERKGGGGQYLALTLADKTGQFEARMWEEFADAVRSCSEGCYVKAQGQISKYQGKFQITLTRMRHATSDEIETSDFEPTTRFDIEEMDAELRGHVASFANKHLQRLVLSFLDDEAVGPSFRRFPAAKRLHHAWIGGLLEHVCSLVRLCRSAAPHFPEVDPDLLITGAILHDIGKVVELTSEPGFNYTLEGQLIGHITIGIALVRERVARLDTAGKSESGETAWEAFPPKLLLLLEHLMLSHHGKLEFGSPKLPMTPEAILLSALDDLEAKFQTMRTAFEEAAQSGKSANQVTDYIRSMDRALFDSQRFMQEASIGAGTVSTERAVHPPVEDTNTAHAQEADEEPLLLTRQL